MNWSKKDIENLKLTNNLHETEPKNSGLVIKNTGNVKISVEKQTISTILWVLTNEKVIESFEKELQFDQLRKFRFDWAIPSLMIAIEYEGVFSKKSRHTTVSGFTTDCEKYNLAQVLGWKVLRYTAKNYINLERDLKNLIKKLSDV